MHFSTRLPLSSVSLTSATVLQIQLPYSRRLILISEKPILLAGAPFQAGCNCNLSESSKTLD
jgi:hypothetical protein